MSWFILINIEMGFLLIAGTEIILIAVHLLRLLLFRNFRLERFNSPTRILLLLSSVLVEELNLRSTR